MKKPLRILFAGTPAFSVPPLLALIEADYQVTAVYTQPDRPAGRGRKLTPSPVKTTALQHGLPVEQPANFKNPVDIAHLAAYQADLMVVVAYGLLLPENVLNTPRLGCINIHASLLPRWRGAAPIQRAVMAGDANSGISIMQMEKGLDTGPVYLHQSILLSVGETSGSLHDKLSELGAHTLIKALPGIIDGRLAAEPQDEHQACYAHKLNKSEAWIDWQQSASQILRQIQAFNPWPVAQTRLGKMHWRIWEAEEIPGTINTPGTIISAKPEGIDVATGNQLLRIKKLQIPGKRAMNARDFINAHQVQGMQFDSKSS